MIRYLLDTSIAWIAEANECIVAADNEQHFEGLRFSNPLREPG